MGAFILPYFDEVIASDVAKIMIHRADGRAESEDPAWIKEGTLEEQLKLNFPFKILKLSENHSIGSSSASIYSHSNLDFLP